MARFNYDVDQLTKYIDVHKQFGGGLKTVDTDDALGAVYLRQSKNVSISEFNFLERRYGTFLGNKHNPFATTIPAGKDLQGYFEYVVNESEIHKIIVCNGRFYLDLGDGEGFKLVDSFTVPEGSEGVDYTKVGVSSIDIDHFGNIHPIFETNPIRITRKTFQASIVGAVNEYVYHDPVAFPQLPTRIYKMQQTYIDGGTTLYYWVAQDGILSPDPATFPQPFIGTISVGETILDQTTGKVYVRAATETDDEDYTLTLLYEKRPYSAQIQSTKEVSGVRVDKTLYIATGTYPVYYNGDGKIYLFPQYDIQFIDIEKQGYDLNNIDLEALIEDRDNFYTSSQGSSYNEETIPEESVFIKNVVISPTIPYVGGKIEVDLAYHLYNNTAKDFWDTKVFDSVMTTAELTAAGLTDVYGNIVATTRADGTVYYNAITNRRSLYELRMVVSSKSTGADVSLYKEIYNELVFTNDAEADLAQRFPSTSSADSLSNLVKSFSVTEAGLFDYKVELVLVRSRKEFISNDFTVQPEVVTVVRGIASFELTSVRVTPEILEDYKEAPFVSLKAYNCNQIAEYNGRLVMWGCPNHEEWLLFSDINNKSYFPYAGALQFSNDLAEGITAVSKFMNILVVQTNTYTFGVKGDAPIANAEYGIEPFRTFTINPTVGCIAPKSARNIRNQLYFLSAEGVMSLKSLYAEDNRYNVKLLDRNIANIVSQDTKAVSYQFDNQYWINFPSTGITLRYYIDKDAWTVDEYSGYDLFGGVFQYFMNANVLRFITRRSRITGDDKDYFYEIKIDYQLPSDLGNTFPVVIETAFLNQNYPFHHKSYKEMKLDFTIQNEYNTSIEPIYAVQFEQELDEYVQFDVSLLKNHYYQITFDKAVLPVGAMYEVRVGTALVKTGTTTASDVESLSLDPIEFMSPITGLITVMITATNAEFVANSITLEDIVLYDSTYDHTLTFFTKALSENGNLNVETPIEGYADNGLPVPINLGTRTGSWSFGTSPFGNLITAVKTVKLSGKGYNCKILIEDYSKTKWTLESMGLTYKMKKARSK